MDLHKTLGKTAKLLFAFLGVVLVAVVYLLLVHLPVTHQLESIQQESDTASMEIGVLNGMVQDQERMEAELERDNTPVPLPPIPDYDNLELLMNFLNGVLLGSEDYSLSFQGTAAQEESLVVARSLSMSVSLSSYARARALVLQLENCPYRCTVNQVSISPGGSADGDRGQSAITDGPVTMSVQLTFYELK